MCGGGDTGGGGKTSAGGSSATSGGPGTGDANDLDTFLEQQGNGFCARLFRCVEGGDDFSTEQLLLKTEQGCKDLLARVNASSRVMRDLRAQVEAGNLHYDAVDGQACLDDLSACNGTSSLFDGVCREAFDGNAKTGEPCRRSEECEGDAYCALSACPGQCAPRKAAGEPCERANECAFTTGAVFCDHSGAAGVCRTLTPTAKASEGQPCTRNFEGAQALTLCQDGFWCATAPGGDPAADPVGQCAKPIATNSACTDGDDFCSDGVCDSEQQLCKAVTLVTKAGAACDKAAFVVCDPILGLRCNAAGTCDASGDGSEGTACFTGDFQWGCDPGLYCAKPEQATSDVPGICTELLAEGAACSSPNHCTSGQCLTGLCVGRPCLE